MNLTFFPFKIQQHIAEFTDKMQFFEQREEVFMYQLESPAFNSFFRFSIEKTMLYFYDDKLICSYLFISKENSITNVMKHLAELEKIIGSKPFEIEDEKLISFS